MAKDKSSPNRQRLTRAIVEGAKPGAEPYRLHDTACPGLFLRVQPSGTKAWNVRHAPGTSLALGKYPHVSLEAARERARRALAERDQHGAPLALLPNLTAGPLTLRAFVDGKYGAWLRAERRNADEDVASLEASFGADFYDLPLTDITPDRVSGWMVRKLATPVKRLKRPPAPATVRRCVARLKGLLSKAVEWELLEVSPLAKLKLGRDTSTKVVRYLSGAEDIALRGALAGRDARASDARQSANAWRENRGYELLPDVIDYADHLTPIVYVALNTGLRLGELTSIVWADINVDARVLFVRADISKSGRSRYVPLNDEATHTLRRWRAMASPAEHDRIFPFDDPYTSFKGVLKLAGIKRFRFHDLRHTFASRLALAGIDLYTIGQLLGHADTKTTQRYAHLSPGHLASAVKVLDASTLQSIAAPVAPLRIANS